MHVRVVKIFDDKWYNSIVCLGHWEIDVRLETTWNRNIQTFFSQKKDWFVQKWDVIILICHICPYVGGAVCCNSCVILCAWKTKWYFQIYLGPAKPPVFFPLLKGRSLEGKCNLPLKGILVVNIYIAAARTSSVLWRYPSRSHRSPRMTSLESDLNWPTENNCVEVWGTSGPSLPA